MRADGKSNRFVADLFSNRITTCIVSILVLVVGHPRDRLRIVDARADAILLEPSNPLVSLRSEGAFKH